MARIEFIDPAVEDGVVEAGDPPLEAEADPRDPLPEPELAFPPEPRLLADDLPEERETGRSAEAPLELLDIPIEAVRIRAPRRVPQPRTEPAAKELPTSAPKASPAPVRARNARLRLVHSPDVRSYYPAEARRRGIEGSATVEMRVDLKGVVVKSEIVRTSGHRMLDKQAVRVGYAHRFEAGTGGRVRRQVIFELY